MRITTKNAVIVGSMGLVGTLIIVGAMFLAKGPTSHVEISGSDNVISEGQQGGITADNVTINVNSDPASVPLTKDDLVAVIEKTMAAVEPQLKREFPAGFILFATDGSTTIYRPRTKKVLFDADWEHVVLKANQDRTKANITIPNLALVSGGLHLQVGRISEDISLEPGASVQTRVYRSPGPSMWYKMFPSDHVTALFAIGFKE